MVICKRCINTKQIREGGNLKMKKRGLVLVILQMIIFFVIGMIAIEYYLEKKGEYLIYVGIGLFCIGLLNLILGVFLRKSKISNIILMIINCFSGLWAILGIIGVASNLSYLTKIQKEIYLEVDKPINNNVNEQIDDKLIYKHDSQLLQMLNDSSNSENIDLVTEDGRTLKFEQEYVYYQDGKIYCILKPLDKVDNLEDDEAIVFVLEEDESTGKHTLKIVEDDELADKVFDSYYKDLDNQENIQNNEAKRIEVNNIDPIKEKKSYLISTIAMGIIYAVILLIGILGVTKVLGSTLSSMAYGENDFFNLAGEALSFAIGMIFFSFIPTFGYFMAFNKLYNLQKKYRVIIFLSSLMASIVMIVVFFITYHSTESYDIINYCDGTAYEQILTIIVSHVGLLVIYLLTFLKIDYEKLNKALSKFKKKASDEPSNTKFLTVILAYLKQFLKLIARVFILLVKGILKLRDRNKPLYYSIFTVVFTILCFFTSFIALVIIIGIALSLLSLVFFGTLSLAYTPTSTYAYEVNEGGYTRTLEYYDYYNGHDRYKDDVGNYWYTDDDGSTFYRE